MMFIQSERKAPFACRPRLSAFQLAAEEKDFYPQILKCHSKEGRRHLGQSFRVDPNGDGLAAADADVPEDPQVDDDRQDHGHGQQQHAEDGLRAGTQKQDQGRLEGVFTSFVCWKWKIVVLQYPRGLSLCKCIDNSVD